MCFNYSFAGFQFQNYQVVYGQIGKVFADVPLLIMDGALLLCNNIKASVLQLKI